MESHRRCPLGKGATDRLLKLPSHCNGLLSDICQFCVTETLHPIVIEIHGHRHTKPCDFHVVFEQLSWLFLRYNHQGTVTHIDLYFYEPNFINRFPAVPTGNLPAAPAFWFLNLQDRPTRAYLPRRMFYHLHRMEMVPMIL